MKIFKKRNVNFNAEEINLLVQHGKMIFNLFKSSDVVKIPKILKFDSKYIYYEYLNLSCSLHKKLSALKCSKNELVAIGGILRIMHDNNVAHADFVPHNIYLEKKIILIDFQPPSGVNITKKVLYSGLETEAAGFIFSLISNFGAKRSLLNLFYLRNLIKSFIIGYVNFNPSLSSMLRYSKKVFFNRKLNGFSKKTTILHTVTVFILANLLIRF